MEFLWNVVFLFFRPHVTLPGYLQSTHLVLTWSSNVVSKATTRWLSVGVLFVMGLQSNWTWPKSTGVKTLEIPFGRIVIRSARTPLKACRDSLGPNYASKVTYSNSKGGNTLAWWQWRLDTSPNSGAAVFWGLVLPGLQRQKSQNWERLNELVQTAEAVQLCH